MKELDISTKEYSVSFIRNKISFIKNEMLSDGEIDKYLVSPPEKVAIKVYREYEKILTGFTGRVVEVCAKQGDVVNKGDVIAYIQRSDIFA